MLLDSEKKYRLYTFQNVMTESMVKTVLTHVVTVLVLMSVIKGMVFVQDPVNLVSKDRNVFLVLSFILLSLHCLFESFLMISENILITSIYFYKKYRYPPTYTPID